MLPPPPTPLGCRLKELEAGTEIHRIHENRFGATDFNPGFGSSRFAPVRSATGTVPTAYAATSFECALFETLFHDVPPNAPFKTVSWSLVDPLVHSVLRLRRPVQLGSLFTSDLMRFNLQRTDLIDTPSIHYPETQLWSAALHAAPERPEGLVWTSRAFDEEKALMLFGDRIDVARDMDIIETRPMASHVGCLKMLTTAAGRAGIVIVA